MVKAIVKEKGPRYLVPASPSPEKFTAIKKRPMDMLIAPNLAFQIQTGKQSHLGFSFEGIYSTFASISAG